MNHATTSRAAGKRKQTNAFVLRGTCKRIDMGREPHTNINSSYQPATNTIVMTRKVCSAHGAEPSKAEN